MLADNACWMYIYVLFEYHYKLRKPKKLDHVFGYKHANIEYGFIIQTWLSRHCLEEIYVKKIKDGDFQDIATPGSDFSFQISLVPYESVDL